MEERRGVVAVVYKESMNGYRYLILKRIKGWEGWELPKGHLEEDDYRYTLRKELEEEAKIKEKEISTVEELEGELRWSFKEDGEKIMKNYKPFLVKVDGTTEISTRQNPHDEHEDGFFLRYEVVRDMLEYEEQKEILEKAEGKVE